LEKITKQGQINLKKQKEVKQNGRPNFQQDTTVRKQRVDTPKSKPGVAELVVWAESAWNKVSSTLTNAYLNTHNKKNLRQLNKSQFNDLEQLKLDVFTNLAILSDITDDSIFSILQSGLRTSKAFMEKLKSSNINMDNMTIDNYRRHVIGQYVEENA
jgi:hypothetical protein